MPDRETRRSDLLMPVSEDHALQQFQIEALRQITDTLRGMRDEIKEDRKVMSDVRERVIRIESNRLDSQVETNTLAIARIADRVNDLERDKDRRDGAVSALDWTLKNWPGIAGFLALVVFILAMTGKLPK